jgi:ankyrin repeat protein
VVMDLLEALDIEVDDEDNEGMTPLHIASAHSHTAVVLTLLLFRADVNGKTHSRRRNARSNLLAHEEERGMTPLHFAAQEGHFEVVMALLCNGAEVGNGKTMTPLHFAAQEGNVTVIKLLLRKGADVDSVNIDRETPLDVVAAAAAVVASAAAVDFGERARSEGGSMRCCGEGTGTHTPTHNVGIGACWSGSGRNAKGWRSTRTSR